MTISIDVYEVMVRRALERGVPVPVVSEIFELPLDICAAMLKEVRVAKYGTSDMAAFRESVEWDAWAAAQESIRSGSPTERARVATLVLGKKAATGPGEGQREGLAELMDTLGKMRDAPPQVKEAGSFVLGRHAPPDG
jgi:hypothetical protein